LTSFLAELRRRNVFRVAAAYLVVGWLLIQISALLEASLGLPVWFDAVVIGFLTVCFPIAVLLAWAFEMTPDGMKLTAAVPDGQSIAQTTGRKLDFAIVAALALMIAFIAWQQLAPRGAAPANPIAVAPVDESASVAVLPFVDLSQAGDQEYFSDGISEEILNVLVRIPGLGVAGRTSSFAFKGRNEDLRVIGEALGVNHVLEGSVRRSGTRLRITAQLIRSSDGFHIWSETYDREIADIFDIQDEIAGAVAGELAVSLGLSAEGLQVARTTDIAAYEAYLEARQLYYARGHDNLNIALALLNEAVALDPNYAPAWSTLASVYSVYDFYTDNTQADAERWGRAGMAAARRAIALDPLSGEAQARLGSFLVESRDLVSAMERFDRALELSPNDASVLNTIAQHYSEFGYFESSLELARRALEIDPAVPLYNNSVGGVLSRTSESNLDEEVRYFRAGIAIDPQLEFLWSNTYKAYQLRGRREDALRVLEEQQQFFPDSRFLSHRLRLVRAWGDGPDAIRAILDELMPWVRVDAAEILDDRAVAIEAWGAIWDRRNYGSPSYFWDSSMLGLNEPRAREQARREGLLALWQARGFPPQCRAVGDDDFECDWSAPE